MTIKAIRSALVEAYLEAADWPTVYENISTPIPDAQTPETEALKWAKFSFSFDIPFPATLGRGGLDQIDGQIQIDMHYKLDVGMGAALDDIDALRQHFVTGRTFSHNDQAVKIRSCGASMGQIGSGVDYTIRVIITWQAWVHRAKF